MTVRAAAGITRVVLPSPNGVTISRHLMVAGCTVVAVSLCNASAAARWVRARLRDGEAVSVIAGGERWPGGELRPAVEDLWGAGAFLTALRDAGDPSPEATAAIGAFGAVGDLAAALHGCAGGRELTELGYGEDVAIAAEYDVSRAVPVLRDDRFVDLGAAAT